MNRDYSSIYTIKDFFQKVIPLYFDKDELALSTVGALGMFIDINSSFTEDMINITARYINEQMPGQAELPDFIYANAVNYGMPQKRERIYMVCFRNDLINREFSYPKQFALSKHVEDFLLDDENMVKDLYVERQDTFYNGEKDDKYSNTSIRLGIVNKGGQGERIYSTKGIAITLSAYGGGVFAKTGGYLVNGRPRKLHPRECARIMGYPDSFKMSKNKNQAYKQFGNSVVVDVLQYIAIEIGKTLANQEVAKSLSA